MSDKDKTKYAILTHGQRFRVIERSTDTILRTLDTKQEAQEFAAALESEKKDRK